MECVEKISHLKWLLFQHQLPRESANGIVDRDQENKQFKTNLFHFIQLPAWNNGTSWIDQLYKSPQVGDIDVWYVDVKCLGLLWNIKEKGTECFTNKAQYDCMNFDGLISLKNKENDYDEEWKVANQIFIF